MIFQLLVDFKGKETWHEDQHILTCSQTFQFALSTCTKAWFMFLEDMVCVENNVKKHKISLILLKMDNAVMDLQHEGSGFQWIIEMWRWYRQLLFLCLKAICFSFEHVQSEHRCMSIVAIC